MATKIDALAETVATQGKTLAGLSDALQALIALQMAAHNGNGNGNAHQEAAAAEPIKRGPGRPPKQQAAAGSVPKSDLEIEAVVSTDTKNVFINCNRVTKRADGTRVVSQYTYDRMGLAAARALRSLTNEQFEALVKNAREYTPTPRKAR